MSNQTIRKKSTFYFPRQALFPQLYYVGYLGIIFSIVQAFTGNYSQSVFFLLVSIIILLLRPWMKLDIKKRTLVDFFAFIPYGKEIIPGIHQVIISEGIASQTLSSRGSTSTISFDEYRINIDIGDEFILLQSSKNKASLLKKAQAIACAAEVSLEDRTS